MSSARMRCRLWYLGTGEERYENMFRHFDWKYNNKVSANIYYSDQLSHKIYAASGCILDAVPV